MNRYLLACLGIGLLLLVFCHRIWGLGPTHTDDAIWRLAAQQGNWNVVSSWATSQGRVFAFLSGTLIYLGTDLQGTTLGSLLHVGSFALFFVSFHSVLSIYLSSRLALMTALVNLALFAIRWEGSIITTYPVFSWVLGTAFSISVHQGWKYAQTGRLRYLISSMLLLFISLNIHEGVSLLFSALAILAVLGNYFITLPTALTPRSCWSNKRFLGQSATTLGAVSLYFTIYALWRLAHPSRYVGNQLGSLNPLVVGPVLCSLSGSGSILADFLSPYAVNYSDAVSNDGYRIAYRPWKYVISQNNNLIAILAGILAGLTAFVLSPPKESSTLTTKLDRLGAPRIWASVLIGLCIACIPVFPVSLVGKYQEHFYQLKVRSYAFTPLCHFGWSLLVATALCLIDRVAGASTQRIAVGLVALGIGALSFCSTLRNDSVISDIRMETCRWDVVGQASKIIPNFAQPIARIHAPRLQSGSWFSVVPASYWSSYMHDFYNQSLQYDNNSISRADIDEGVAYIDYCMLRDNTTTIVFAAALHSDVASGQVIAKEIGVTSPRLDPSEKVQYVMTYRDLDQGTVAQRLSGMAVSEIDRAVLLLRNVRAVPASIRISKHSELRDLNIECGDRVPIGVPIRLGLAGGPVSGDGCKDWLKAGGWHPPERNGSWTSQACAEIHVPLHASSQEKYTASIVASTLGGLGFYDTTQTVSIKVGNETVAYREFAARDGWKSLDFELAPSHRSMDGTLVLSICIDPIANPKSLGLSPDTRNLGVLTQSIRFQRKTH